MGRDAGAAALKVALRLCFVKLPDTPDRRIFRDAMTFTDPDERCYQDLSDIVERKISFMEIPPADFTVLYTEPGTGDHLVVDDAYFSELVAQWFKPIHTSQQIRARNRRRKVTDSATGNTARSSCKKEVVMGTGSFSQVLHSPEVLIGGSLPPSAQGEEDLGSDGADGSSDDSSSSGSSGSAGPVEVQVTFDIEVNRLRQAPAVLTGSSAATGSPHPSPLPSQHAIAQQQQQQSSSGGGGVITIGASTGIPEGAIITTTTCAPLTVANLFALAQQDAALRIHATTPTTAAAVGVAQANSNPPPPPPRPRTAPLHLHQPQNQLADDPPPPPPVATTDVLVTVDGLTCPPQLPNFFLRCVPIDMRFKMPKAGLIIGEIDFCDVADPRQMITGVTFDASVQREVKESLRCDGRQVVELRRVYARRKNEMDARYATNAHPLLLRIDRGSRLEVVQVLPVPITARAPVVSAGANLVDYYGGGGGGGNVISVRDNMNGGGVVELTDLTRSRGGGIPSIGGGGGSDFMFPTGYPGGTGLSSSSSGSTAARRTTFTLGSGNSGSAAMATAAGVSGVVPSGHGHHLRQQQQEMLSQAQRLLQRHHQMNALPFEPGVIPVSARDVRAREALIEQHANRELVRKERVRRKLEVSAACILCGLDLSPGGEEACAAQVRHLLGANKRNRGAHVPTVEELRDALADRRPLRERGSSNGGSTPGAPRRRPTRLTCAETFVDLDTHTRRVVHCRCAHLCTAYQNGGDLDDHARCELPMQECSLCGLPGAFVSCYHPDCREMYHAVCALYCGGYVNFGKKDPFLPCPACPRHTQVILTYGGNNKSSGKQRGDVRHVDDSCWADGDIAFDSRVVAEGDLRDPDENGGE